MENDTSCSLEGICNRRSRGLIPQLLDIQNHRMIAEKSFQLRCLRILPRSRKRRRKADNRNMADPTPSRRTLRRIQTSTYQSKKNYVAISYPWHPCELYENPTAGGYQIELGESEGLIGNTVRDVVLDRAIAYATYRGVDLIWIDQESINQDDPDEQEKAVQSMDIVYSFSKYPLGLLCVPIESQEHLDLLLGLLRGEFTDWSNQTQHPVLKPGLYPETARKVLELLRRITSDRFWRRAWIFQEEYRSSVRMCLLIPHSRSLRKEHAREELGDIPGELQVNSAAFRHVSTLFCLAYLKEIGQTQQHDNDLCKSILERAGKYNILLRFLFEDGDGSIRKGMSPTIFADIGRRKASKPSDLLAIAANCCDYPCRLNTKVLRELDCSLSLCILALYLLNGEIIRNDNNDRGSLCSTIFEYLKSQSLDIHPPVDEGELTFIKRCRFVNVELTENGIRTTGWLWKLSKEIDTTTRTFGMPFEPDTKETLGGLNYYQRSRLRQLASELESQNHVELANDIHGYLREDVSSSAYKERQSKQYKDAMAEEVVQAIKEGKVLRLGCILGDNPYRGIFITERSQEQQPSPSYAFTAWKPAQTGRHGVFRGCNIEKFVSLEVDKVGSLQDLPRLRTKRWLNGLCFVERCDQRDVVFPWPFD